MDEPDARRYRAWQRWQRRTRQLEKLFNKLYALNAERYRRELDDIYQATNQRIATLADGDLIGYIDPDNKPKGLQQNDRPEAYHLANAADRLAANRAAQADRARQRFDRSAPHGSVPCARPDGAGEVPGAV